MLKDANNDIISKNFYKVGNIITLKASINEEKATKNDIKWAYKIMDIEDITLLQQGDSMLYNPLSKYASNYRKTQVVEDTFQIIKNNNEVIFSQEKSYTIKQMKENIKEPKNIKAMI